jgi:hypothetical protein
MSYVPLTDEEKAKKCTEYSISSEDWFRCINRAQVQLFSYPKQALPGWAIAVIIFIIFVVLLALDFKYKLNYFSGFFNGLAGLFTSQSVRRRY